jgi:hypothetical protein
MLAYPATIWRAAQRVTGLRRGSTSAALAVDAGSLTTLVGVAGLIFILKVGAASTG